jgi:NAD-dependent deacetylase
LFPYIQEPVLAARRWGAPTVEINPSETLLSHCVDYRVSLGAAHAMEEISRRLA